MPTICLPFAGDTFGGSVVSATLLMEALAARGFALTIPVHGSGRTLDHLRSRGLPVTELPALGRVAEENRKDRLRPGNLAAFAAAVRHLLREKPDIVHLNDKRMIRTWSLPAAATGRPTVVHWRSTWLPSRSVALGLRLAAAIPCISRYNLEDLPDFARRKAEVVHNPFAPPLSDEERTGARRSVRERAGIPPEAAVIGYFGAFSRRKRPRVLLDLLRAVPQTSDGRPVYAIACGAPLQPQDDAFLEALATGAFGDRLVSPGSVQDPLRWMAATDVVVMPSSAEPFGRVVVEAWAAGANAVVSTDSGAREVLRDGENGLLADPEDPDAWIRSVRFLLDADDVAGRMRAEARRTVETLGIEAHADRIVAIYDRLLARGRGSR